MRSTSSSGIRRLAIMPTLKPGPGKRSQHLNTTRKWPTNFPSRPTEPGVVHAPGSVFHCEIGWRAKRSPDVPSYESDLSGYRWRSQLQTNAQSAQVSVHCRPEAAGKAVE